MKNKFSELSQVECRTLLKSKCEILVSIVNPFNNGDAYERRIAVVNDLKLIVEAMKTAEFDYKP